MKKGFKFLTAKCLAGLMLTSVMLPVSAQDYNYNPGSNVPPQNYNSGYNQPQNLSPQNYNPGYNQPQALPSQNPIQNYNSNYIQPVQNTTPQGYNFNADKGYSMPEQNGYNLPPLQGRVITVPVGTVISGASSSRSITSKYMTPGDPVNFILNRPYYFAGTVVLPAGTNIQGSAVIAQKAGFAGKHGKLKIVFSNAVLPNGQRIPVSGKIATEDGTGILIGGTTADRVKKVAKNTAIGAGGGALLGLIGSAVSGGKKGKGTAIMTGIGAGAGLLKSGVDKGVDVEIGANMPVNIVIDQPLIIGGNRQQQLPPANYNNYGY